MAAKASRSLKVAGLLITVASLTACKWRGESSRLPASHVSGVNGRNAQDADSSWETVNSAPQLSVDEDQFYFYWGLWRKLTAGEKKAIQSQAESGVRPASGSIISRRSIVWTVHDCATAALLSRDHEEFYFMDPLEFDAAGELLPLREAYRPGWRYFSMANFDSTLARTDLSPPVIPRLTGERDRDWKERVFEATQAWRKLQSRRGQRGEIRIQSSHRIFASAAAGLAGGFVSFLDYRAADTEFMDGLFARFNPARWPVFYDERAHKLHSVEEPPVWRESVAFSENEFTGVLNWNWCDKHSPVRAVFEMPDGTLPPPGPNRPGRTDRGNAIMEIKATQGLTKNTQ